MGEILIDSSLTDREFVFEDRTDAGKRLAQFLERLNLKNPVVFAIPSGGVPVGIEVAKRLKAPLIPLIVRKIQLPWDTEAGFGAVNQFGDVFINSQLVEELGLTAEEVQQQVTKTIKNVKKRLEKFGVKELPDLSGKTAIIVDDGLAAGFTIMAAVEAVKRLNPEKIVEAVPTCSPVSLPHLANMVNLMVFLTSRRNLPFAVANAYRHWRDLEEDEVLQMLREFINFNL